MILSNLSKAPLSHMFSFAFPVTSNKMCRISYVDKLKFIEFKYFQYCSK